MVRIGDQYYTWSAACPIVMSAVLYGRGLPSDLVKVIKASYQEDRRASSKAEAGGSSTSESNVQASPNSQVKKQYGIYFVKKWKTFNIFGGTSIIQKLCFSNLLKFRFLGPLPPGGRSAPAGRDLSQPQLPRLLLPQQLPRTQRRHRPTKTPTAGSLEQLSWEQLLLCPRLIARQSKKISAAVSGCRWRVWAEILWESVGGLPRGTARRLETNSCLRRSTRRR